MSVIEIMQERFRKARVWLNDSPIEACRPVSSCIRKNDGRRPIIVEERRIVIEVAIPIGFTMYGLLGGKIEPNEGGFELLMNCLTKERSFFVDALVSADSEEVRIGLCEEFLPAVTKSLEECVDRHSNDLPNARLTVDVAACGSIGSNSIVFKKLSQILFETLVEVNVPTKESLSQIMNRVF